MTKIPFWPILMAMRVRFTKNVDCDLYDRSMDETYPKYFSRWDELLVESIVEAGDFYDLVLTNGDVVSCVPTHSITKISPSQIA